jgi:hypothetical protein
MSYKRKRVSIDLETKYKISQEVEKEKYDDIASRFGLKGKSNVSEIVRKKDKIIEEYEKTTSSQRKSLKTTRYKDVEDGLINFITNCNNQGIPVNGPILQEKAKQIAVQLDHNDFGGTMGFIDRFKARNKVIFETIHGEAKSVSMETTSDWINKKLPLL